MATKKTTKVKTENKVETTEVKKVAAKAPKKEMKTTLTVQFMGKEMDEKSMVATVKKAWTKAGNKVGDIRTMELYVKPEEASVYYVINGSETGRIDF